MGLIVDPRAGSKTLIRPLRKLGVHVTPERHEFGDVIFWGNGPEGLLQVGVEHKRIEDVIDCIKTGRFASHQLPGLIDCFGVVVLLVQGRWRADRSGRLIYWKVKKGIGRWVRPHGRKEWLYRHVAHWLSSIQFQGGIHVATVEDVQASAVYLKALATWWGAKEWEDHDTLKVFNESGRAPLVKPTVLAHMAKAIRGVGWDKAHAVARHFKTPRRMTHASADEWRKVPGIGKEIAERAVTSCTVEGTR